MDAHRSRSSALVTMRRKELAETCQHLAAAEAELRQSQAWRAQLSDGFDEAKAAIAHTGTAAALAGAHELAGQAQFRLEQAESQLRGAQRNYDRARDRVQNARRALKAAQG